jgi:hypothetical protein
MRAELLITEDVEGLYMLVPRIRLVEVWDSNTPLWIYVFQEYI